MEILTVIISIIASAIWLFLIVCFCAPFLLRLYGVLYQKVTADKLKEQVNWCTDERSYSRCRVTLLNCIYRAQADHNIETQYQLIHEESSHDIVNDILRCYQKDMVQKYFHNRFTYKKMTCENFFMKTLQDYLNEHRCEKTFNENKMYDVKNYQYYGNWGGPSFDATYVLTKYAFVYHKMLHITQVYYLSLRQDQLNKKTISRKQNEFNQIILNALRREIENTQKILNIGEMEVSNL